MTTITSAQDLVCILDNENFQQLFSAASPMRMSVREGKIATKFQVEDGDTRSDHVVVQQTEITIDFIIEDEFARDCYQQIKQAWSDNRLVSVQGKVSSYPNMLILEIPHDESPEYGMGISMPIRLVEWRSVEPQYGALPPQKVKYSKQSSTAKKGQKQTSEADTPTRNKASVAYRIFNQ
jgi:hypothetical protein